MTAKLYFFNNISPESKMTHKIDIAIFGVSAIYAAAEMPNINMSTISAAAGLIWFIVGKLPKFVFYINKAWHGMKQTAKGEKLPDNYLDNTKNDTEA